ncbi:MAG: VOC family protein, partial [Dehalococcoidia bacterium]
MLELKRLDHVAMAAPDWRSQSERLQRLLGFKFLSGFADGGAADFDGCVSQVPETEIEFEVISPRGPESFVRRFLDEQGPGLHHITLEVEDIHAAAAEVVKLGLSPFGGIQDDGVWYVTYLHPRDAGGVLYQLFETHTPSRDIDRSTPDRGAAKVLRADHVSMAAPDIDKQIEFQQRVLGMELDSRWEDPDLAYVGATMKIPGSKLEFEIMQPLGDGSFVQKFMDERRPGLHHMCLEVESVE